MNKYSITVFVEVKTNFPTLLQEKIMQIIETNLLEQEPACEAIVTAGMREEIEA